MQFRASLQGREKGSGEKGTTNGFVAKAEGYVEKVEFAGMCQALQPAQSGQCFVSHRRDRYYYCLICWFMGFSFFLVDEAGLMKMGVVSDWLPWAVAPKGELLVV